MEGNERPKAEWVLDKRFEMKSGLAVEVRSSSDGARRLCKIMVGHVIQREGEKEPTFYPGFRVFVDNGVSLNDPRKLRENYAMAYSTLLYEAQEWIEAQLLEAHEAVLLERLQREEERENKHKSNTREMRPGKTERDRENAKHRQPSAPNGK